MTEFSCPLSECSYGESGICLEGYESELCPNLQNVLQQTDGTSDAEADSVTAVAEAEYVELNTAEALEIAEWPQVLAKDPTTVVLVAGRHGSGKTTLIASLYDEFRNGPIDGLYFAGSDTLIGFEQRCHLARVASYRSSPSTKRTSVDATDVGLHLRHKLGRSRKVKATMMLDLSGETFRAMREDANEVRERTWLKRVDRLAFVVDMADYEDPRERRALDQDSLKLARRLSEEEALRQSAAVDLIATKWDVLSPDNIEPARQFLGEMRDRLASHIQTSPSEISLTETAAQPRSRSTVPRGYGLSATIHLWRCRTPMLPIEQPICTSGEEFVSGLSRFQWVQEKARVSR